MLGTELTAHLGYEEGKDAPPGQRNRRNGTSAKVLKGQDGELPVAILRDRDSSFEPALVGAYIKAKIFDEGLEKVRRRNTNPVQDHQELGRILGSLGASRLSQNLNQLARAANRGALPVSPDVEAELKQACADIAAMRDALMRALGSGGPS